MQQTSHESAILGAIMDAAVDAIVVSDHLGEILRANPAARNLFNYSESELIGRNVRMLMPEELAAQHDKFMARHIETGENRIIGIGRQVEGKRKGGEIFPLHLSVGEARISEERIFIAILHDATRRVASEAALARSQRLDAIGRMTGGITHDFNNLLTVIIGNLELLEMESKDVRKLKLLDEARQAAEMATDLTSRLMLFARRGHLKPKTADLREVSKSALELLKRTLGSRFRITTEFAEHVSRVLIDPVQLQTALMNLALNSRDAMPDGGELNFSISDISIDDDYMAQETDVVPGDYVRLMISDNGEGMSAEAQKKAFEPFFTTKGESHGTGLGLAMVYGFVRQSGGHITLYSEIGHGTSFGLYFPVVPDSTSAAKEATVIWPDTRIQRDDVPCVLVVEDNASVRRITVERLNALGCKTLTAEDADVALGILNGGASVDLVFSDIVMPGSISGYDLAKKVKAEFPQVKVLLTSGYASDIVTRKLAQDNDLEILHKPYHQRDLAQRLQALLVDASE